MSDYSMASGQTIIEKTFDKIWKFCGILLK